MNKNDDSSDGEFISSASEDNRDNNSYTSSKKSDISSYKSDNDKKLANSISRISIKPDINNYANDNKIYKFDGDNNSSDSDSASADNKSINSKSSSNVSSYKSKINSNIYDVSDTKSEKEDLYKNISDDEYDEDAAEIRYVNNNIAKQTTGIPIRGDVNKQTNSSSQNNNEEENNNNNSSSSSQNNEEVKKLVPYQIIKDEVKVKKGQIAAAPLEPIVNKLEVMKTNEANNKRFFAILKKYDEEAPLKFTKYKKDPQRFTKLFKDFENELGFQLPINYFRTFVGAFKLFNTRDDRFSDSDVGKYKIFY
jgi:hypothetical protein